MRLALSLVLGWAKTQRELPDNPAEGVRLPREVGGRKITRTELEPEQTRAFVDYMEEPYATLVLFEGMLGRRIEEAVGLQPDDLDEKNVLHIRRIVYNGRIEVLEKEQTLPLDAVAHAELIQRIRVLGAGHKWVFHSRNDTPLNPGNSRRRHLHPAAQAFGVKIGGWHDFRHTLTRAMRRAGVHPVVISGTPGHKKVELAPEVYDRTSGRAPS